MTKKIKEDEATEEVNAPEPTDEKSSEEETSSDEENLEDSEEKEEKEEKVEEKPEVKEVESKEIEKDYLEEEKPEVDYKKRYGDSTREFQDLRKRTDPALLALENLDKLSKLNPKIEAEIEAAKKMSGEPSESSTLVKQQVDEALGPVKKIAEDLQNKERLSKVKVLAAFEKKNPKLFSPKATKKEKTAIRQRIGKVANALVETGVEFPDAVKRAYFTVNPKAAIQEGKDKAYVEGLDEKQAGFSSQSSTEGKKPTKPKYSSKEMKIGDKMGKVGGKKVGEAMRKEK